MNRDQQRAAIEASLNTISSEYKRLVVEVSEKDSQIESMQQVMIEMQHRIDSPEAEAIDAVMNLAKMRRVHWLVILNEHWNEDLSVTLQKATAQYRSILQQRDMESDPHGARNG